MKPDAKIIIAIVLLVVISYLVGYFTPTLMGSRLRQGAPGTEVGQVATSGSTSSAAATAVTTWTTTATETTTSTQAAVQTGPQAQKAWYSLRVSRVYVYSNGPSNYFILAVGAAYTGPGSWSVNPSGFELLGSDGNLYEMTVPPDELLYYFNYIPAYPFNVSSGQGLTYFELPFALPSGVEPVKLVYNYGNLSLEAPVNSSVPMLYVSCYNNINANAYTSSTDIDVDVMSDEVSVSACFVQGQTFEVTFTIDYFPSPFVNVTPEITSISATGANVVGSTPGIPIPLTGTEESVTVTFMAPSNSYTGDLDVTFYVSP